MNELKYSKRKQLRNQVVDVQEFKAITSNELDLTRQCENVLKLIPDIKFIRIPDAIYKTIFGYSDHKIPPYLKAMIASFIRGLPDFIILKKFDDIYCRAVCFELKTGRGKMTQGQKNFAKVIPVIIIRSFEQFTKELNNFLEG